MKLSSKNWNGRMNRKVEYYYSKDYGGVKFVVRSDIEIIQNFYQILDVAYPYVMMGADGPFIENRILESLHFWNKIKSAKVVVNGKECEIRLSTDPREFIG